MKKYKWNPNTGKEEIDHDDIKTIVLMAVFLVSFVLGCYFGVGLR